MQPVEYRLDFATKATAERALDYYENQPGYQGGGVMLPTAGETCWHVRVAFTPEMAPFLSNDSLLEALSVVHVSPIRATAH